MLVRCMDNTVYVEIAMGLMARQKNLAVIVNVRLMLLRSVEGSGGTQFTNSNKQVDIINFSVRDYQNYMASFFFQPKAKP